MKQRNMTKSQSSDPSTKTRTKAVTIADVARAAQCSPATVSLVLNDQPLAARIPATTKRRINEAVANLGYVPNVYAKYLRQPGIHIIGILCADISDPFCSQVLHGIMQQLNESNVFYQLVNVDNDVRQLERFFQTTRGHQIEGIIAILNTLTLDLNRVAELVDSPATFVMIGRAVPGLSSPCIQMDNREGVRMAIRHLWDLGHRDIAFIFGPPQIEEAVIRRESVFEICRELGIVCRAELTEYVSEYPATSDSGRSSISRILARKTPFTAVFSFDDFTAYGVIQELEQRGLGVPRDVSVMGFDDIWLSAAYNPPLTTIRHPMLELGIESARMVVKALETPRKKTGTAAPPRVVLMPELVVRASTAMV